MRITLAGLDRSRYGAHSLRRVKATLFDRQPAVDAEEAYWLEVKTVAQFETGGRKGVG